MTTFSYTTGNPSNLTGGTTASMNDIQGPLTDVRTFVNGKNLDMQTNIATSVKGDIVLIAQGQGAVVNGVAAGNYVMGSGITPLQVGGAGVLTSPNIFSLVSTDHAIPGLTTNVLLRVVLSTNATAPTGTWTCGIAQINVAGGASQFTVPSTGGFVGSQVAFVAPGASGVTGGSTSFALPGNQNYGFVVVLSGNQAANSLVGLTFNLYKYYS